AYTQCVSCHRRPRESGWRGILARPFRTPHRDRVLPGANLCLNTSNDNPAIRSRDDVDGESANLRPTAARPGFNKGWLRLNFNAAFSEKGSQGAPE
ncbi:MAG: hypothetical protein ACK56I_31940, partial [bacterium]